jgi:pimeloyl-ACP methyl ester carboxylesterase
MTQAIEVLAKDGVTLRGELRGRGSDVVVLVHGRGRDLDSWWVLASTLAGDGLRVVSYDLRGHGGSEGEPDAARDERDLEEVVRVARASGADRLFLGAEGSSVRAALAVAERVDATALFALEPLGDPESLPPVPSVAKLVLLEAVPRRKAEAWHVLAGRSIVVSLPVRGPLLDSDWGRNVCDQVVRWLRDVRMATPAGAVG